MAAADLPPVFPRPRRIERREGPGSTEEQAVVRDPTLPMQGYRLDVSAQGARIVYADDLGLRYARHTLRQLHDAAAVPSMVIEDHPDHLHRGYMLDISRDRVPTDETLRWLVGVLAELRYDHLELYTEHTYAYADHEVVWRGASPLTAEDLHRLDDLCAAHGIELVANQNTFGHMERWLRHDAYRPMAECPDGATSPFTGRPMPPTTLAPGPAAAAFALELVRELTAQIRSPMVNIGADEPFELGQGASAAAVAAQGRAAVYLAHLDRLLRPLVAEGHHVLFWGDVLRRHPELVTQLPRDGVTAVVWHYEAPSADAGLLGTLGPEVLESLGLPDDFHRGFAAHVRSFAETGFPFWVAPGTSTWNSLIGRWSNARANILDAAVVGRDRAAGGLLLTDWGDNGHLQPLLVSLLPMAYAAGVAWCAEANHAVDVTSVVDRVGAAPGLGGLLARLGDAHLGTGVASVNASGLFAALDPTRPSPLVGRGDPAGLRATADLLEGCLADAQDLDRPDLVAAVRLARHGAWRLAARGGAPVVDDAELAADAAALPELHREGWLASSRPGGLEDSLRHVPTAAGSSSVR